MQGFNMGRYVPPELEGIKSFNQASGKKPGGRKPDGSQVVRFECPFAIWCTNCDPETIIGQGVRFNAEKRKVGNYYSTPIWAFRIKHTVCGGWIEVRTDPQNTEYVVVEGGRRRDTGVGGRGEYLDEEGGLPGLLEPDEQEGAFGRLERKAIDKEVADKSKVRVEELKRRSDRDWTDPYEVNKKIRREFRVGRRERQENARTGEQLQDKFGLGVDVVAPTPADLERAKLIDFTNGDIDQATTHGIFERRDTHPTGATDGPLKHGRNQGHIKSNKSSLQSQLQGNTRSKTDPFGADGQSWRRPSTLKATNKPTHEATDIESSTSTANQPINASKQIEQSVTKSISLVAYDSD